MRVTQRDVAHKANVSQATVSRVLAGDGRVEPELKTRVIAAMKECNYRVDLRAKAFRQKRTNLIGLVMKRPHGALRDDPFFGRLIAEITDELAKTPYHLCLDFAHSSDEQAEIYDDMLRTRRVDGLLMVEPEMSDPRLYRLQAENFPFVLIGNSRGAPMHSVDNDNVLAGRMATIHLLENGFRNVGFIGGPKGVIVSDDRITGYQVAMGEWMVKPRIWHADFGFDAAARVAQEILDRPERPDALVVLDDFMATGVANAARVLGLDIPDSIGLVSFNDTNLCNLIEGGLTSVNLNFETLVRTACERLITVIESKGEAEPSRCVVPCVLKVRNSSLGGQK